MSKKQAPKTIPVVQPPHGSYVATPSGPVAGVWPGQLTVADLKKPPGKKR